MSLSEQDLSVPGSNFFGHRRSYSNQLTPSYNGPNGYNWWVSTLPYVTRVNSTTVAVIFDPSRVYWFYQSGSSYTPQYDWLNVSLTENTGANLFTFVDAGGGRAETTVLNSLSAPVAPGAFVSHTDSRGVLTQVTSRSGNQVNEVQRGFTVSGVMTTDSLLYSYVGSGVNAGELQSVTWRRQVGGGFWTAIKRCAYAYYGASDANGVPGDLQSASQQLPCASGGWSTVGVDYYRYWLAGSSTGFAHALKIHIGPEGYRQLFNLGTNFSTVSDATLLPYVDEYFEYDPTTRAATKEISAVCSSCPGGGTTSDLFAYTSNPRNPLPGYNVWFKKTVQTLPDSSQIVVYTNYTGMPMLKVNIDPGGTSKWGTFYRYNASGQLIWTAMPSAVALPASLSTLEAYDDLLNYNSGTSLYQYLNNSTGLINVTDYYTSTNLPLGQVQGQVADQQVKQGQSGTPVMVQSFTYTSNTDANGVTIYPVATQVSYPIAGNTTTKITTAYSYTYYSGLNTLQQRVTNPPLVSTGQNGSGSLYSIVEQYDSFGNLTSRTDERGIVNNYSFDPTTGLLSQQVLNYQSGVTQPGVNMTSDFSYDIFGRRTLALGPTHTVVLNTTATAVRRATYSVYIQSGLCTSSGTWDLDQTWVGNGYATGSSPYYGYGLVNPVSITKSDKDGRVTDQIAALRSSGSGPLSITDTFNQSDWQSWTSTQYDSQHRTSGSRNYFLIPGSGTGTAGTNYAETLYGYDALERRNRVVAPGGTITRTVWTTPQWVASTWVGTNDTGATDSNPAGSGSPNNMVQVVANQYDGGSAGGDGNLTQQTQYASASDTRVTSYGYDFRDRRTSMDGEIDVYAIYTYDNLDRLTQTDRKNTTSGGNLIGRTQSLYDDRGRVYQTLTYAVDPSTSVVGNAVIGKVWYGPTGNVIQQINPGDGQVFTKTVYNGVNWVISSYRGYNPGGTSYSQATTVANDIILEQTDNTYDEVGNVLSTANSQRLNDAPSTGTGSTGALSYGSNPKARVSYLAMWVDGIDRTIASANYGALSSFTRPSTPPSSSSTVLVSSTAYDSDGRANQVTDPMGNVTTTSYDAMGRTSQTVEAFGTGSARTTSYTYTLDNLTATMTAVNGSTGDQTTTWAYGTTLTASGVARNDLLVSVTYPDSVSGSDVVSYTYNRLGQQLTITDQRGTVRTFYYDKLGRQTDDAVTTVGTHTDNAVRRISRIYEVRGMVSTISSVDNATPGSGTTLNQVAFTYNTFRQLVKDQQDHAGGVSGSTPSVQYAYDTGGSSSNEIRLNQLTYPNGRTIAYSYGSSGGMSDYLNRVDAIQDTSSGTTTLASYTYLGLGTVVRIAYPQPSVWLDLWGGTSGTFNGIDLFGRIIDQRWQNSTGGTPTDIDRYQYGYDQDSNRIWKANTMTSGLDEFYVYDPLNRLTQMQRGTLNGTKTGITGTPAKEQDWTLDPTGNWSNFIDKVSGTTDLNQTRTANKVNEITNLTESTGPTWAVPAYDQAGNMTTMPQPASPASSYTAVYDAWNRMVSLTDGTNTVAQYKYDGRNFRIVKLTYTGGTLTETRHVYFTSGWQDIEERVGTSTSMDKQYVWGIRYIDELVCRDDATPLRLYVTQDANFNVTALLSTSGTVQQRFVYDPYGTDQVLTAAWAAATDVYAWRPRHQGLELDSESSLLNNRYRILHACFGRHTSRDPIGYSDASSLYSYESENPLRYLDPFGEEIYLEYGDDDDYYYELVNVPEDPNDKESNTPAVAGGAVIAAGGGPEDLPALVGGIVVFAVGVIIVWSRAKPIKMKQIRIKRPKLTCYCFTCKADRDKWASAFKYGKCMFDEDCAAKCLAKKYLIGVCT